MADIIQEFTIKAPQERVFETMSTPAGLDRWWTKSSSGEAKEGEVYRLHFGPEYEWRAKVTRCEPGRAFELQMNDAHEDWKNTRVGFELQPEMQGVTRVRFYHTGWPAENEHWRVSCYCWPMYLRLLRRFLQYDEFVP
jgi:uncharacterized protein YndB with AHSA1/START domain